jgi:hypothetical protein
MARIEYTATKDGTRVEIGCGWDYPLQTFFFDVLDLSDPNGPPLYELPMFPPTNKIAAVIKGVCEAGFEWALTSEVLNHLARQQRDQTRNHFVTLPEVVA